MFTPFMVLSFSSICLSRWLCSPVGARATLQRVVSEAQPHCWKIFKPTPPPPPPPPPHSHISPPPPTTPTSTHHPHSKTGLPPKPPETPQAARHWLAPRAELKLQPARRLRPRPVKLATCTRPVKQKRSPFLFVSPHFFRFIYIYIYRVKIEGPEKGVAITQKYRKYCQIYLGFVVFFLGGKYHTYIYIYGFLFKGGGAFWISTTGTPKGNYLLSSSSSSFFRGGGG